MKRGDGRYAGLRAGLGKHEQEREERLGALPRLPPGLVALRELGRGGMGVVVEARDEAFERVVAVKVLLPSAWSSPEAEQRFVTEARTLARLRHPHVVTVHDLVEREGVRYLVMERIEGESLAARLRRGPLPPAQATTLAARLADALAAVHAQGVLHRDVKPGNVLLRGAEDPVLTDFGVARVRSESVTALTRSQQVLGTLAFMAPEQANAARDLDARADVYALGATLSAMLTGQPPFAAQHPLDLQREVLETPARPPSEQAPEVGPGLDAIVLRCLAKHRARRFASAGELAEALRAARAGVVPAGRIPRAGLVAGVVVALLAFLAAGLLPVPSRPPPASPVASRPSVTPRSSSAPARHPDGRDGPRILVRLARLFHAKLRGVCFRRDVPTELIAWGLTGEVQRWRWADERLLGSWTQREVAAHLVCGAQYVAVSAWYGVSVRAIEDGAVHAQVLPGVPIEALALSRDGTILAAASEGRVILMSFPEGRLLRELGGHESTVRVMAFDSRDELLATGCGGSGMNSADYAVRVWRVADGALLARRGTLSRPSCLAWAPAGDALLVGDRVGKLHLFAPDLEGPSRPLARELPLQTGAAHSGEVWAAVFSRDGRRIFSASAATIGRERTPNAVCAWDAETLALRAERLRTTAARYHSLDLNGRGQLAVAAMEVGEVSVWDADILADPAVD